MCSHSTDHDLTFSVTRWYDVPALLLGERPVRCRNCRERFFVSRLSKKSPRKLHRLWMHYVLCSTVMAIIGIASLGFAHVRNSPEAASTPKVHVQAASR